MCGLIGFSGAQPYNPEKIKILMLSNIVRGTDSTGIYANGVITKEAISCEKFVGKHKIEPGNLFIGHTRKATTTVVSDKTAHPFQKGNTIGVHNGSISNKTVIQDLLGLKFKDYDVDSELLIEAINQNKIKNVLEKLDGAAAVMWTDTTKPEYLYCFRNSERPLFRGRAEEGIYLSSLEESLIAIGIEKKNIEEIKTDRLYTFHNGVVENNHALPTSGFKKYVSTTTPATTPYSSHARTYDDYYEGYDNDYDVIIPGDVVSIKKAGNLPDGFYFVVDAKAMMLVVWDYKKNISTYVARGFCTRQTPLKVGDTCKLMYFKDEWENNPVSLDDILYLRKIEPAKDGKIAICSKWGDPKAMIYEIPYRILIKADAPASIKEDYDDCEITDEDSIPFAKSTYESINKSMTTFQDIYTELDSYGLFDSVLIDDKVRFRNAITELELIMADISALKGVE